MGTSWTHVFENEELWAIMFDVRQRRQNLAVLRVVCSAVHVQGRVSLTGHTGADDIHLLLVGERFAEEILQDCTVLSTMQESRRVGVKGTGTRVRVVCPSC